MNRLLALSFTLGALINAGCYNDRTIKDKPIVRTPVQTANLEVDSNVYYSTNWKKFEFLNPGVTAEQAFRQIATHFHAKGVVFISGFKKNAWNVFGSRQINLGAYTPQKFAEEMSYPGLNITFEDRIFYVGK